MARYSSQHLLQDAVGRQPDRITHALGFEELVDLWIGKGCITAKIETLHGAPVAGDHRRQHNAPAPSALGRHRVAKRTARHRPVDATTTRPSDAYLAPGKAMPTFGYGYFLWLLPGDRRQFDRCRDQPCNLARGRRAARPPSRRPTTGSLIAGHSCGG